MFFPYLQDVVKRVLPQEDIAKLHVVDACLKEANTLTHKYISHREDNSEQLLLEMWQDLYALTSTLFSIL